MGWHRPTGPTVRGARSNRVSVGVIGGGIGGLSAALSLLQAGLDVQVYEQAPMLGEVGAGINLSPNASRVLHRLGLAQQLARTGVKPAAWHQRRWDDGRTLLRTPLAGPLEAAFGFPQYQIHRADLLAALADALPQDRVHLDHQLPIAATSPTPKPPSKAGTGRSAPSSRRPTTPSSPRCSTAPRWNAGRWAA
jgi:2-polyprenyl-6-methoxyphenol hydroxylase-like FAD-dependent oxidoreductase